jgi:hypothetical protein
MTNIDTPKLMTNIDTWGIDVLGAPYVVQDLLGIVSLSWQVMQGLGATRSGMAACPPGPSAYLESLPQWQTVANVANPPRTMSTLGPASALRMPNIRGMAPQEPFDMEGC